jgi:hypothetical protein
VLPETVTSAPEVLGEQAFAETAAQQAPQSQQALPTSVNAGAEGQSPMSGTTSLLGLLLVLLGGVSARLGWTRVRG